MTGRPRRRGVWIAVAVVTALTVIVPTGLRIWGRLLRQTESVPAVSYGHAITALQVEAGRGSVTIGTGPPGQVAVGRTLRWTLSRPHVVQSWHGDTLVLKAVCGGREDLFAGCDVDLNVRVPAAVTVRATVSSGTITAQGLTGAVHLQARSGTVNVERTRGPVWARANSGAINGTDLSSPQVDVGTSSGAVGLGFADAPQQVKATARSGSVTVALPRGFRYRVHGTSSSGDVRVDEGLRDDGSSRRIDVATSSGAVRVRYAP
jgi:Putative adhesin